MAAGEVAAQGSGAPSVAKKGETSVTQSSWWHTPETLRRCLSPSLSRTVTSLPEGHSRKGICTNPSVKQGALCPDCVHRGCTHKHWAVPSTTQSSWQWGATGPDPNNSWFTLPELPSKIPGISPNIRHKPPRRGFGLGGCDSSPHGVDPPLALFAPHPYSYSAKRVSRNRTNPASPQRGPQALIHHPQ